LLSLRQSEKRERECVEVITLVCSQQLLEEDETHKRQRMSAKPTNIVDSDPKKRCEEKDSLSFPSSLSTSIRQPLRRVVEFRTRRKELGINGKARQVRGNRPPHLPSLGHLYWWHVLSQHTRLAGVIATFPPHLDVSDGLSRVEDNVPREGRARRVRKVRIVLRIGLGRMTLTRQERACR
jgi:hypothetical protein